MDLWSKLPLFWRFQLVGWGVFVIVTFPLKFVIAGSATAALILCAVRDGSSFLLTWGMRWIYRSFWSNEIGRMAALIALVCAIGGALQYGFFFLFRTVVSDQSEFFITQRMSFSLLYERTGILFGWSFLYFGIRHAIDGIQRELRLALIESENRQAQLQMLRAQMNPHFLFNALNAIQAEVGAFSVSLKESVKALAGYLRFSLDHTTDEFIPLGTEYDAVMDYFKVEKLRFGGDLELESHIDESARDAQVPGIIMQPLVENAVKYGQQTSELPLRVWVRISRTRPNEITISVANTGEWIKSDANKAGHIGLGNVRHRLALIYPGKHRLDIEHGNGWVTVNLRLLAANFIA